MTAPAIGDIVQGVVCHFDSKVGYGFVRISGIPRNVVFHRQAIQDPPLRIGVGSLVAGRLVQGPKGLVLVQIKITKLNASDPHAIYFSVAVIVVLGLGLATAFSFLRSPMGAYLVGINGGSLFMMGLDKSLARSRSLRAPEIIFYLLGVFGGAPGLVLGSYVFRHKTRKAVFQLALLLIFTGQLALLRLFGINFR